MVYIHCVISIPSVRVRSKINKGFILGFPAVLDRVREA